MFRTFATLIVLLTSSAFAAEPARQTWTLDGVEREGLVYVPESAAKSPTPVVFVFHGHGGTMRNAARQFRMHELWPEAISVYLQGLNTPGQLTDPEGKKPGWQRTPGDQGDRDLKLFDAVLASLKKSHKVDETRIYSTGHSNGGGFTYLLWAARGDVFAAVAPSAAAAARNRDALKPKPVLHLAGEKDTLVKYEWQQAMIAHLRKLNGCGEEGKKDGDLVTVYASPSGTPVWTYIHPGGHQFTADAPKVIVKFFKEQVKAANAR
jgi:polyhydroxybutyrate depolymerase